MSAYLTSNDTISALITYWEKSACHRNYTTPQQQLVRALAGASHRSGLGWDQFQAEQDAQKLIHQHGTPAHAAFALLVAENVRSLKARYPDYAEMWSGAPGYRFRPSASVQRWLYYAPFGHGNLVGMAKGYSYQACEHDEWECSAAFQLIEQIKEHLLSDLARRDCGDEGQWASFEEPAQAATAPRLVSLTELAKG